MSAAKPFTFSSRKYKLDWKQRCLLQSEVIIGWSDGINHRQKKGILAAIVVLQGVCLCVCVCVCVREREGEREVGECCLGAYLLLEKGARHAKEWKGRARNTGTQNTSLVISLTSVIFSSAVTLLKLHYESKTCGWMTTAGDHTGFHKDQPSQWTQTRHQDRVVNVALCVQSGFVMRLQLRVWHQQESTEPTCLVSIVQVGVGPVIVCDFFVTHFGPWSNQLWFECHNLRDHFHPFMASVSPSSNDHILHSNAPCHRAKV